MIKELDKRFVLKKGVLVSNIYPKYVEKELGKKLDVEFVEGIPDIRERLNSAEDVVDYLVIIYDKDEDSDGENLSELNTLLYDVLYEKVLLVCDGTLLESKVNIGTKESKLIPYTQGFNFNDIVQELKEWYKDEIEESEVENEELVNVDVDVEVGVTEDEEDTYKESIKSELSTAVDLESILSEDEEEEDEEQDEVQDEEESEEDEELMYELFEEDIVILDKKEGGYN